MDAFDSGASPPPRRLEPDPFARLSDDLVACILALVASNGVRFLPNPRLTTAAATAASGTNTATSAAGAAASAADAAAEDGGDDGSGGASAERDDGFMARNVGNEVNGSVNSEDEDAHGDASEDELHESIERAVKSNCARFVRVVELTSAIALEVAANAGNYERTMTVPIDPDAPVTPSTEHILASRLSALPFRDLRGELRAPSASASAVHCVPPRAHAITDDLLYSIAAGCARSLTHMSLYRHRNLRSWDQNLAFGDLDDAVTKVTEPAVTALFAACRRLVSLKLVLPVCLPELPASVSLLQQLTRLEVSCGRVDFDFAGAINDADAAQEEELPEGVGSLSALRSLSIRAPCVRALPHTLSRLHSLTSLKIDHCVTLRQLPDGLGQLKNLRHLQLADLQALHSLSDSIGLLSSLETLHLRAVMATTLPDSSAHLSSLKRLLLSSLPHLQSLPDCVGELPSLQELTVQYCPRFSALPRSLSALASLTALTVQRCGSLAALPEDIGDAPRLASLVLEELSSLAAVPESVALLSSRCKVRGSHVAAGVFRWAALALSAAASRMFLGFPARRFRAAVRANRATSERSLPTFMPDRVGSDEESDDEDYVYYKSRDPALTDLPSTFGQLANSLTALEIHRCHEIQQLPTSFTQLTRLQRLCISNCHKLSGMPAGWGNLVGLQEILTLHTLPSLSPLPPSITALTHLQRLHLSHMDFSDLPEDLGQMKGLRVLTINTAPKLLALPASLTLLTSLQHLMVSECENLPSLPEDGFGNLSSLVSLTLKELPLLQKLPAAVAHLPLLQVLDVQECEELCELTEGLESARSLWEVYIEGSSGLEDLPQALLVQAGRIQVHAGEESYNID
ncbi:unnamed protein product [Closterium sp. Yama58-4]|nr:unnamed protein product [Closterium sp. Yama58-4]